MRAHRVDGPQCPVPQPEHRNLRTLHRVRSALSNRNLFGIDQIRAVIVDDAEGIAAQLDANMSKSVDAYRDPWQDGRAPATEGQFRTSLPLVALPQVPVR